jgi:hypothetical protein
MSSSSRATIDAALDTYDGAVNTGPLLPRHDVSQQNETGGRIRSGHPSKTLQTFSL